MGRIGGSQPVSLGKACESVGVVIHELMHVAGFWHEHTRADRDDYIEIKWDNIQSGMEGNFAKYNLDRIQYLDAPYDIGEASKQTANRIICFRCCKHCLFLFALKRTGSVMHYNPVAYAKNSAKPTIVARQKSALDMGQRKGFSKVKKNTHIISVTKRNATVEIFYYRSTC